MNKINKSNENKIEINFHIHKLFQIKQILTKKLRTKLKTKGRWEANLKYCMAEHKNQEREEKKKKIKK
jgi:hypothetical protein